MIYVKCYKDYRATRNFYGLDLQTAYQLELECLSRVKGQAHMCQLLDYDSTEMTLTLKWAGSTLQNAPRYLVSRDSFIQQFTAAFEILESLDIVHFDISRNNVCIDQTTKCISIIDFGSCVIDGSPQSSFFTKAYNEFIDLGGYSAFRDRLLKELRYP